MMHEIAAGLSPGMQPPAGRLARSATLRLRARLGALVERIVRVCGTHNAGYVAPLRFDDA